MILKQFCWQFWLMSSSFWECVITTGLLCTMYQRSLSVCYLWAFIKISLLSSSRVLNEKLNPGSLSNIVKQFTNKSALFFGQFSEQIQIFSENNRVINYFLTGFTTQISLTYQIGYSVTRFWELDTNNKISGQILGQGCEQWACHHGFDLHDHQQWWSWTWVWAVKEI